MDQTKATSTNETHISSSGFSAAKIQSVDSNKVSQFKWEGDSES
jgi:hypothetical protein